MQRKGPLHRRRIRLRSRIWSKVLVEAQTELLDFPAEWNVLAEPGVKIDEKANLSGCFQGVGLDHKLLLPLRMCLHSKGNFFNEAVLREVILCGFQPGHHRVSQASEDDPPSYVGVPFRLKIKCVKN